MRDRVASLPASRLRSCRLVERRDPDALPRRLAGANEEDDMPSVVDKRREADAELAGRRIDRVNGSIAPSGPRRRTSAAVGVGREDDVAARMPDAAARRWRVGKIGDCRSSSVITLEPPVGEKRRCARPSGDQNGSTPSSVPG